MQQNALVGGGITLLFPCTRYENEAHSSQQCGDKKVAGMLPRKERIETAHVHCTIVMLDLNQMLGQAEPEEGRMYGKSENHLSSLIPFFLHFMYTIEIFL